MRKMILALSLVLGLGAPAAAAPDFSDRQDFEFADRGFMGTRAEPRLTTSDGRVVFDLASYEFLKSPRPPSVNASLWRHSQLLAKHGLFEVTPGIWQVRGFDVSNITFIAGKTGWIIIDPLTTAEAAKAALELANQKLGARPVTALIYTHSHADHFGGGRGVVSEADLAAGKVAVIAPEGFLEHAVSENVIAGPAMNRRATYQFGTFLPRGPYGLVSVGIGPAISGGTVTLIPPNVEITRTGETMTVDGVRIEFQLTPGTEAPAEMNLYLPNLKALCLAENANVSMHNVLTPRGALVRDAKAWADYLTQSARLYADKSEVMFTSHGWPRWGKAVIADYLGKHRDAYKFLHDQSVRLMNEGLTGPEIANRLALPETLDREWYNRGYYGTLSFNSRAVYQRYMGWYDANPVNLAPLEPADASKRYVDAMGGRAAVAARAEAAFAGGDDRWAGELGRHLVYSDADDTAAKTFLAKVLERQATGAESAIGRNMYLSGAQELRQGVAIGGGQTASLDVVRNTPTPMFLDLLSVRLDPAKSKGQSLSVDLNFTDRNERFRVTIKNDVLTHEANPAPSGADAIYTLPRAAFLSGALAGADLSGSATAGDRTALARMLGWLTAPRQGFAIMTR